MEGRVDITSLLVSLISGAVGGNAAGAVMKEQSLGTLGNSIAGIIGGGAGGAILQVLGLVASGGGGLDLSTIVGDIAGGGVGGAIVMALIGAVRKATQKA
jgi:uncharacterized membrane protein YeaQ/YmgE (transglycosylase-associated protein family)